MQKKFPALIFSLLLIIGLAQPLLGQPFIALPAFQNKTDGTIVYAADWNNTIGGLYVYITNSLLPQLNALTQKGDLYGYTGSSISRLPVGSNGQVLTANAAAPLGINWAAGIGLPITTKGDIVVGNGSGVAARLGVGTDGKVLTADSTQTNGLAYESVVNLNPPSGAIIIWYQTYGGTPPVGWHLCDGTNGTPNLIGMVVMGAQYTGGSATANASGYGNSFEGTVYSTPTISHNHNYSGTSSNPSSAVTAQAGTTVPVGAASSSMTVNYSGGTTSANVSTQPASLGLQYIMKL
jgi:hypothetical protein